MGIRKITFDNSDIVLAKDQVILYDLLLKQQTKTLLPNNETIYQNSRGFLIQNKTEKLKYTYKTTDDGVEFTFNQQLYLSIFGHIIKLEKDTKLLVNKNYVANNENYYIVIRVDLNKESKIINGELKEFGNPVEIKLINKKEKLTQDNLIQKPNDGIYEFPLISFKTKFKKDINTLETIKNIKDESTYLLPLLIESSRNQSKLLTITQKIQEEKELLQEKQNKLKNIKNYLTNLEYIKTQELKELEEYIQNSSVYQLENFTRIYPSEKPFNTVDDKWYVVIWRADENFDWNITKFKNDTNANFIHAITLEKIDEYYLYLGNYFKPPLDIGANLTYVNLYIYKSGILPYIYHWEKNDNYFKSVYRWNGVGNPNIKGKTVYFFDLIK